MIATCSWPRQHRPLLGVRADARVDKAPVEPHRLVGLIKRDRVLLHPRRTEVIDDAAYGDNQGVVAEAAASRDLPAVLVEGRREDHLLLGAIESDHLAVAVPKVVPMGLGEIIELVLIDVHAAGRHFMQQRLPQMAAGAIDQGDSGLAAATEGVAQLGRELEARGAATDHHNLVQVGVRSLADGFLWAGLSRRKIGNNRVLCLKVCCGLLRHGPPRLPSPAWRPAYRRLLRCP